MIRGSRREVLTGAAALSLAGSAALAQPAPPPLPFNRQTAISMGSDAAERMTAPVWINGKGPFPFLVDTGADRSAVTRELAAELALPPGGPIRIHGVAGESMTDSVMADSLLLGDRRFSHYTMPLLLRSNLGAAGLLGVDTLRDQRLTLDVRHNRMIIEGGRPTWRTPGEVVVTGRSRFGQLVLVDASIMHEPLLVVLDTGAEVSIGNRALRDLFRLNKNGDPSANILSVTGQSTYGDWALVPEIRVGKVSVRNLAVVFSDLHSFDVWHLRNEPALLLGMDALRTFDTVQVDFEQREVRFRLPPQGI